MKTDWGITGLSKAWEYMQVARYFRQEPDKSSDLSKNLIVLQSSIDAVQTQVSEIKGKCGALDEEVKRLADRLLIVENRQDQPPRSWPSSPAPSQVSTSAGVSEGSAPKRARSAAAPTDRSGASSASSGADDRSVVLVGFETMVSKAAATKWLSGVAIHQHDYEVLCATGSRSARLVFKSRPDASDFLTEHKGGITYNAPSAY